MKRIIAAFLLFPILALAQAPARERIASEFFQATTTCSGEMEVNRFGTTANPVLRYGAQAPTVPVWVIGYAVSFQMDHTPNPINSTWFVIGMTDGVQPYHSTTMQTNGHNGYHEIMFPAGTGYLLPPTGAFGVHTYCSGGQGVTVYLNIHYIRP